MDLFSLNQKVIQLKERQENYVIKMHAESDYIVSKEAKLLESFTQIRYLTRVLIQVF